MSTAKEKNPEIPGFFCELMTPSKQIFNRFQPCMVTSIIDKGGILKRNCAPAPNTSQRSKKSSILNDEVTVKFAMSG